jgi:hypothetical protein
MWFNPDMNLIEVFALLALAALTFFIYICLRHRRTQAVRAQRMTRSLELALRAHAALPAPVNNLQ